MSDSLDTLGRCRQQALCIVAGMAVVALGLGIAGQQAIARLSPGQVVATPWMSVGVVLLCVLIIVFIAVGKTIPAIVCVTLAAALSIALIPCEGTSRKSIIQAISLFIGLLLAAFLLGLFTNFFAAWTGFFIIAALGLMVVSIFWLFAPPTEKAWTGWSACVAVLFALWTVHDVKTCANGDPWAAALAIFLDLWNLLQATLNLSR